MPQERWAQTSDRLATILASLPDAGTVVVTEVAEDAVQESRRWFRRARPTPVRYVQFRRDREMITGECVGAASWGGYYDIDADADSRVRAAGWLAPDQVPDALRDSQNYRVDAPRSDARRLAEMSVAAFEALGLAPDAALEWQEH